MEWRKARKWWYGSSHLSIREELVRVGEIKGDIPTQFADASCLCGGTTFQLSTDEEEGVAVRMCTACGREHLMCDSELGIDMAELYDQVCACGKDVFEITVGVSLHEDSVDVRWLYVGCRCPACGLSGCYGDWPNDCPDYSDLLARA